MAQSYKDLVVWQKSMDLVVEVYKLTANFPKDEIYGLSSQIKRSAVSIPSNIAEGKLRYGNKEFKHFLQIALASGGELETQVELSKRLFKNIEADYTKIDSLLLEVMKILVTLISSLAKS